MVKQDQCAGNIWTHIRTVLIAWCPLHYTQPQVRRKASSKSSHAKSIPANELSALEAFLDQVYLLRGWCTSTYLFYQAWQRVLQTAITPEGGGWEHQFSPEQMNNDNTQQLVMLIDRQFFNGVLLSRLLQPKKESGESPSSSSGCSAVKCEVIQKQGPNSQWVAYFSECNVIYLNQSRWGKHVTAEAPVNCEGVVCRSRLEILVHTLAHELVHAIVFHVFPQMDKHSKAYLANDRHGPVFLLLNHMLFGHPSDAFHPIHR